MRDHQAFLLRDVLKKLHEWCGREIGVYVWDAETGWSFLGFRGTLERLDLDADIGGSDGRLEVQFAEAGHVLILYADLLDAVEIDGSRIELGYRGGNTEIALSDE
jgi:hypothetical protein